MFTQVENSDARIQSGLGIGLTLVRRLVQLHGGTVEVHSDGENLGSTFCIRLPAVQLPDGLKTPGDVGDVPATELPVGRRVLIVDDNIDALESLSTLVAAMGNNICKAQNGLEAVQAAETFRPNIVLMDLGMPHLNGYEAAKRIRQEPWGRDLTLVATTGWGQEAHRHRASEAGFDHHLIKPIDLATLRSIIQTSANSCPSASALSAAEGLLTTGCKGEGRVTFETGPI
jgi:CheY-like chemotaxis protein